MAKQQGQEENSVERDEEEGHDLGSIEIEPEPEPDDDDDEPAPAPGDTETAPIVRPSKAKRGAQYRELREKADKVDQLETQLAQMRDAQSRMGGMLEMDLRQRQQNTNPFAQLEDNVQKAYEEQNRHYEHFMSTAAKLSPEERAAEAKRAQELDRKKAEAQFELVAAQRGIGRQPSAQEMEARAFQAQLNARYPDLVNTRAGQAGLLKLQQKLLMGKPYTWETIDECADEARTEFGMTSGRRQPKPDAGTKAKFQGIPRGGSGSAGQEPAGKVKISKNQDKMVSAMYPDLYAKDENKARQKWWNNFGKKGAARRTDADE